MNNDEVKLDALELRIELLEKLLIPAWVVHLSRNETNTTADAQALAIRRLEEKGAAIRQERSSTKGALLLFQSALESLKSLVQSVR